MSHKKIGPDRFSRFDVYWIQTDKPNLYIEGFRKKRITKYIKIFFFRQLELPEIHFILAEQQMLHFCNCATKI